MSVPNQPIHRPATMLAGLFFVLSLFVHTSCLLVTSPATNTEENCTDCLIGLVAAVANSESGSSQSAATDTDDSDDGETSTELPAHGIFLYHAGEHTGDLTKGGTYADGRAGGDAICAAAADRPAGIADVTAIISVSAADDIAGLPLPAGTAVYDSTGQNQIADDWADMVNPALNLNMSIYAAGVFGAVTAEYMTGSNTDGTVHANNCSGFTSDAGTLRVGYSYRETWGWLWEDDPDCGPWTYYLLCAAYR